MPPGDAPKRPKIAPSRSQDATFALLNFDLVFGSILASFWLPKCLPKASQNVTNSRKSQPKHEKDEFCRMSTSLKRDTNFRGSRIPKTPPKSTKNAPKVPQKSH